MAKKTSAPKDKKKGKVPSPDTSTIGADLKPKKPMLKKTAGRPSEIEEKKDLLIQFIKAGNPYSTACGCACVAYRTFLDWMQQGRLAIDNGDLDSKYSRFLREVEQAKSHAQSEVLSHWMKAVPHNWQAAKEYLARVNPDEWGSKEKLDVTSNGESVGKPIFLPLKGDE